jgi:D-arabinose 5-phosphate isomerase GutQ
MNATPLPLDQPPASTLSALRTLGLERAGIAALEAALLEPASSLAARFDAAVALITRATGRVIVTGMGKSGHVGRKIAATLASTGAPAYFVHPGEASHGDLGMIQSGDVILALSWSGETAELADIITYSRRYGVALVAVTSNADSALGREADVCLDLPKSEEACPNGLAPTTSTTMATHHCPTPPHNSSRPSPTCKSAAPMRWPRWRPSRRTCCPTWPTWWCTTGTSARTWGWRGRWRRAGWPGARRRQGRQRER